MAARKLPEWLSSLLESWVFLTGIGLLVLSVLPVVLGWIFTTPEMADVYASIPNQPPGTGGLLGTQAEGRDVLAVLALATPSTFVVGFLGGGLAVLIGAICGFSAGYFGGRTDSVVSTAVDIGLTIPPLALLILIASSFPFVSVEAMALIVASTAWMIVARVIRAQVMSLRQREYIKVAKISGLSDAKIILAEIMPNLIPFLAGTFVNAVTSAILAAISLEALGLGPKNTFTLGRVIYDAIYYSAMWRGIWWWWLPPILILLLVFCGLFLISTALDRIANPRSETES